MNNILAYIEAYMTDLFKEFTLVRHIFYEDDFHFRFTK